MDRSGSVDDIFRDFCARRFALLKAFTTEFEDFYNQCNPQVDNLCLYGLPTGHWEVVFPVEEVPPDIPEPVIGINFSREGTPKKDWLTLVALHSDVWLLSVAFYLGTRFRFDKDDRKRLFNKINSLPTLFEVVTGASRKQSEEISSVSKHTNSKSKSNSKVRKHQHPIIEANDEDDDENDNTVCAACGENYASDEFWICCDICERWYHGQCVKITPAKAEHMKQFNCASCTKKRARH